MTAEVGKGVPDLGRLAAVPLREVWSHEAQAFTPWLLANADALGEVLDMDLEISAAEHAVGGFSLDLVGRDLRTDEIVIIENQLETTDHAHLGQLLTYAGGTDAATIVWIAREFREEHRAALDWLNTRTDTDTRFFGVEVSAVRIGESLPAPLFRLVTKPNGWGKAVRTRAQAQSGTASPRSLLFAEFWELFFAAMRDPDLGWSRARKAPTGNWFDMPAGVTGVQYTIVFGRRGLQSEIYFGHPDAAVNDHRYHWLLRNREVMESTYGSPLSFEPLEHAKACRIADYTPGSVLERDRWPSFVAWFVDAQQRLRAAVEAAGGVPIGQQGSA